MPSKTQVRQRASSMSFSSKHIIRTVLGDIPADFGGHIQCHEHIFLRKGPSFLCNKALLIDDEARSTAELIQYRKSGGALLVDAQPGGYGRDAAILKRLSAKSNVHIVAVTGFHKKCFMEKDADILQRTQDQLVELLQQEIEIGVSAPDGSLQDAKAGLIKVSCDVNCYGDSDYMRMYHAAAEAAAVTGASVLVHTEAGVDVMPLIRLMGEHGIATDRLILCHLDRTNKDLNYHRMLFEAGCYLCYDSIHRLKYLSDEEEMALLVTMRKYGNVDRMLLSLDTTNERLHAYAGTDMGLNYLLETWLPKMAQMGFSKEDLTQMCCHNGALALAMKERTR